MNGTPLFINRILAPLVVAAVLTLASGVPLHAQTAVATPPTHPPTNPHAPTVEPPPAGFPELITPTEDPAAAKKIEEALQGGPSVTNPGGMLGEVIGIIQKQGSVLDGSSLDPRFADPEPTERGRDAVASTETALSSVQAAEALLRTARILESHAQRVGQKGDARPRDTHPDLLPVSELVRYMRLEATRLLATEFPQAIEK